MNFLLFLIFHFTVNEKIFVQCSIWAENLYDTVDFEIMEEDLARNL
jgi:hypothetical protein